MGQQAAASNNSCSSSRSLQVGNKDSEDMYLVPVEHFTSHCLMYFVCQDMARTPCHRHRPCHRPVLNAILKRLEDIPL